MKIDSSISIVSNLAQTAKAISRALEHLATGKRVNSAQENSTVIAQDTGLTAQLRGIRQSIINNNQAQGMLNVATGAIGSQLEMIQRMRELAVQAANGILSSTDRANMDLEFQQLYAQFQSVTTTTTFNGSTLLDGSFATKSIQVGSRSSGDTIDLGLSDLSAQQIFWKLRGTGTYTQSETQTVGIDSNQVNADPVLADLNGDGDLDLIQNNGDAQTTSIRLGNGNGTFAMAATLTNSATGEITPIVADFNGDGKLDILQTSGGSTTADMFIGNGDGTFKSSVAVNGGSTFIKPVVGDINRDGVLDFINLTSVRLGRGDGTFTLGATLTTGGGTTQTTLADLNADGILDYLVPKPGTAFLAVRLGNGNGTFSVGTTLAASSPNGAPIVADFSGDGIVDILDPESGVGDYFYLGTGGGNFTSMGYVTTPGGGIQTTDPVAVADFNGDGILDLAQSTTTGTYMFLGNGNGQFHQTQSTTQLGTLSAASDINGDGIVDLTQTPSFGTTITTYLGNGNGTFRQSMTITNSSLGAGSIPTFISTAMGDLNGDGFSDIVASNIDLNGTFNSADAVYIQGSVRVAATASDMKITTQAKASALLGILDNARDTLLTAQTRLGSVQERLGFAVDEADSSYLNISEAKSKLNDSDYAEETADLVRNQVLQQAQIAAFSQSTINMKMILQLMPS